MRKKKKIGVPIRTLVALLAVALLLGGAIGGTMAWLTSTSGEVVNTFTDSDINITLTETDTEKDEDDDPNTNSYKMVPGGTLQKDPKVILEAGSEACWVFVEVTENKGKVEYVPAGKTDAVTTKWSDFLDYTVAEGWIRLDGKEGRGAGVYYREVSADKAAVGDAWGILTGNQVTVKTTVTKEMMNALKKAPDNYPTLTFKAYAIQTANIDSVEDAWEEVNPTN